MPPPHNNNNNNIYNLYLHLSGQQSIKTSAETVMFHDQYDLWRFILKKAAVLSQESSLKPTCPANLAAKKQILPSENRGDLKQNYDECEYSTYIIRWT